MPFTKRIAYVKNALSLLFYDFEDDPDQAAAVLVAAIDSGLDFTFDHSRIDRRADKDSYKKCLLIGLVNRIKGKGKEA